MPVYQNRTAEYAEHVQGGEGRILRDKLVPADKLGGPCSYLACISLEPGNSIGEHQHVGDNELYYLINGSALYTEDGVEYQVKAGDAMFCDEGSTHGIVNNCDETISFVAVMQKTNE